MEVSERLGGCATSGGGQKSSAARAEVCTAKRPRWAATRTNVLVPVPEKLPLPAVVVPVWDSDLAVLDLGDTAGGDSAVDELGREDDGTKDGSTESGASACRVRAASARDLELSQAPHAFLVATAPQVMFVCIKSCFDRREGQRHAADSRPGKLPGELMAIRASHETVRKGAR